jgi:hypothetical protein
MLRRRREVQAFPKAALCASRMASRNDQRFQPAGLDRAGAGRRSDAIYLDLPCHCEGFPTEFETAEADYKGPTTLAQFAGSAESGDPSAMLPREAINYFGQLKRYDR